MSILTHSKSKLVIICRSKTRFVKFSRKFRFQLLKVGVKVLSWNNRSLCITIFDCSPLEGKICLVMKHLQAVLKLSFWMSGFNMCFHTISLPSEKSDGGKKWKLTVGWLYYPLWIWARVASSFKGCFQLLLTFR